MGTRAQDLTEMAQKILEKAQIQKIYGMKNILSAGAILFCRLTDSEQKSIVQQANYDINDPADSIRFVNGQTEPPATAEGKKHRGRAKSS